MIRSDTGPCQPLCGLAQLRDTFERGEILGQEPGRLQERHSLSKSSTWAAARHSTVSAAP